MEWYLIKVEKYEDIGKNEEERISVRRIEPDTDFDTETWGGCAYKVHGIHIHPATTDKSTVKHEDETANSDPVGVKTMPPGYGLPSTLNKSDIIDIKKRFNNVHSRIQQLEVSTKDDLNNTKLKAENTNRQFAERIETIYNKLEQLTQKIELQEMLRESDLGQYHSDRGNIKTRLSELEQAFVKYAICAKPGPQYIASEHIEPGQLLCRNADGTVKPAGVNEIPDGIATRPIVHPIKQFKCTDCANCCRIYIKTTHETTPTYCPYEGKVNWQEYTETIPPSGSTEQADCSKEKDEVEEATHDMIFYKNRLANLQQLATKTYVHNGEIYRLRKLIESKENFLKNYELSKSMEYRLVCNNCNPKCVLHFDNHDIPMAVPDCPWHRNTKEWELQCKLSDGLWRRTAWNPET